MKRFFSLAAAVFMLAMAAPHAQAQDHAMGAGAGRGRMTEMLFKDITLTDAQKTQTDSIVASYRPQMQALGPMRGNDGAQPDSASMAKRRDLMSKEFADLRKVLTPEQQTAFDKNVTEMRERMG
jgi:Spy/CpxP family protein refolding chaperone